MRYAVGVVSGLLTGLAAGVIAAVVALTLTRAVDDRSVVVYGIGHAVPILLGSLAGLHSYCASVERGGGSRRGLGLWRGMRWQTVVIISLAITLVLTAACMYLEGVVIGPVFESRTAGELSGT